MGVIDFSVISGCMLGIEFMIPSKEEQDPEHPRYRGFLWSIVIDLLIIRVIVQKY